MLRDADGESERDGRHPFCRDAEAALAGFAARAHIGAAQAAVQRRERRADELDRARCLEAQARAVIESKYAKKKP